MLHYTCTCRSAVTSSSPSCCEHSSPRQSRSLTRKQLEHFSNRKLADKHGPKKTWKIHKFYLLFKTSCQTFSILKLSLNFKASPAVYVRSRGVGHVTFAMRVDSHPRTQGLSTGKVGGSCWRATAKMTPFHGRNHPPTLPFYFFLVSALLNFPFKDLQEQAHEDKGAV